MLLITFIACSQGHTKEFGCNSGYDWKWLKVHFNLFYAILKLMLKTLFDAQQFTNNVRAIQNRSYPSLSNRG